MAETPSFARSPSFDVETPHDDTSRTAEKPGTPFFADYVMDLSEAHDLAETPDHTRPQFDTENVGARRMERIQMPSLGKPLQRTEEDGVEAGAISTDEDAYATSAVPQSFNRISNVETDFRNLPPPKSRPRWPRDIPWAVAFVVFIPISAMIPILDWRHHNVPSPLAIHPLSTASLHALFWAGIAALVLSRALYRTAGGGDGDNARHVIGAVLNVTAPISVGCNITLALMILFRCPTARIGSLIPIWYTIRDLYLIRRWRRRTQQSGAGSRHAFFQALTSMVLDIMSRSLRRASFFRVLALILAIQFGALVVWRWALLAAVKQSSIIFLIALLGFKWATGTVARMLTLIASGGVMSWFSQQAQTATEMSSEAAQHDGEFDDHVGNQNITEAYRTVDASVYQSVADMDDVLDDDYELDDDEFMEAPSRREANRRLGMQKDALETNSTVKSILFGGLTVSFGSVCQCGLVGGLAQFVWSQVRKLEFSRTLIHKHRNSENGFQGMQIDGTETTMGGQIFANVMDVARGFVRRYSDLAMCHVAIYYKSYERAALDVGALVEESGVEPVLHDDISTHMCSCVGGTISGIIVIISGSLLLHQRKGFDPPISDTQVVENMIAAFIFSYTMIFTVMEPLRASIKAVYVSFAQNPDSLSKAFPIIYHRLQRLSSVNR